MIIGFGFGSPLMSILMLVITGGISYLLFRFVGKRNTHTNKPSRSQLRQYYYEQRRKVRELSEEFDLTDEEIEKKIADLLGPSM